MRFSVHSRENVSKTHRTQVRITNIDFDLYYLCNDYSKFTRLTVTLITSPKPERGKP